MDDLEKQLLAGESASDSEEDSEPSRETTPADTLRILEALLFASDELLTTVRLKAVLPGNPDAREIGKMVERINQNLQKERHPFEIVEIGGGYQFKTIAYYHPWVRQLFQEKAAKRLSMQALECLSIIAYRQPISKAEIEAIRGVLSDGAMKTLLEKRLITITGRSEKPGRPLLYGTTQEFLHYFGLGKIVDLPNIEEFEAMVRKKVEDLPIEELKTVHENVRAEAAAAEEAMIEVTLPERSAEASLGPTFTAEADGVRAVRPDETAVFEVRLSPQRDTVVEEADVAAAFEAKEHPASDAAPDVVFGSDENRPSMQSDKKRKKNVTNEVIAVEHHSPVELSTDGETVYQAAIAEEPAVRRESGGCGNPAEAVFEVSAGGAGSPGRQTPDTTREEGAAAGDDAVFEVKV